MSYAVYPDAPGRCARTRGNAAEHTVGSCGWTAEWLRRMKLPRGRAVNIALSIVVPVVTQLALFAINIFVFQWGTALGPFLYVLPFLYIAVGFPFLWRALAWRALLAAIVYVPLMLVLMFFTVLALEHLMSILHEQRSSTRAEITGVLHREAARIRRASTPALCAGTPHERASPKKDAQHQWP